MHHIDVARIDGGMWLEIDGPSNAIDYLERVLYFLKEQSNSQWKWISIALDGALCAFCAVATQGTNPYDAPPSGTGLVTRRKKGDRLVERAQLLKRVQDKAFLDPPISLTESQNASIETLRDVLRNNFEHFTPKSQAIELSGMPQIIKDIVAIIEHLVLNGCGASFDDEDREHILGLIGNIRQFAEQSFS